VPRYALCGLFQRHAQTSMSYLSTAICNTNPCRRSEGRQGEHWLIGLRVCMLFFMFVVVISQDSSPLGVSLDSLRLYIIKLLLDMNITPGFLQAGWHYALYIFWTCYNEIARCPSFLHRQDTWQLCVMYAPFLMKL
jgi:hypothetical protein